MNIGAMRDIITVSYENVVTVTPLGGRSRTFTDYEALADVQPLSSSSALKFGIDVMSDSYTVTLRPPATGRPIKITYETKEYKVISSERDKLNQFLRLIVEGKR